MTVLTVSRNIKEDKFSGSFLIFFSVMDRYRINTSKCVLKRVKQTFIKRINNPGCLTTFDDPFLA